MIWGILLPSKVGLSRLAGMEQIIGTDSANLHRFNKSNILLNDLRNITSIESGPISSGRHGTNHWECQNRKGAHKTCATGPSCESTWSHKRMHQLWKHASQSCGTRPTTGTLTKQVTSLCCMFKQTSQMFTSEIRAGITLWAYSHTWINLYLCMIHCCWVCFKVNSCITACFVWKYQ